jgi:hypothetical protein
MVLVASLATLVGLVPAVLGDLAGIPAPVASAQTSGASCTSPPAGTALSRDGWTASTNAPSSSTDAPANAIDGNLSTRFSTDETQRTGLYLELDLGSPQTFDQAVMLVPNSPTDYARAYQVEVSSNGSSWTTVATCTGTGTSEVASFPAQTAQYVLVQLTGTAAYYWSVDEIYLYASASSASGTSCTSSPAGTALPRNGWTASTNAPSPSSYAPANAIDGNLSTRFSTGETQRPGLYLELNLGSPQTFDQVFMLVPNSPTDYARAYQVEVSSNGSSWTTVASCTGTGTSEVASFPAQTAQYVLVALTGTSTYWWSVDEIYLYSNAAAPGTGCTSSPTGTALPRTGWTVSTNAPSSSADAPANAIDGNLSTRFSTGETQRPGLYLELNLGSPQTFDQAVMLVPNSPTDYARAYQVEVSSNGSSWTTVASCTGTGTSEVASFPAQTAQYVLVALTGTANYWWSVDEIYLYTNGTVPTTTTTTTTSTTTQLSASANPVPTGAKVTLTARVSPTPSGGTVEFVSDGVPIAGCHGVSVNTASGAAICATSFGRAGSFGLQAFYGGSGSYQSSSSNVFVIAVQPHAQGYWVVTRNGHVYAEGGARAMGDFAVSQATGQVVGIAATPSANGYWVVTSRGAVQAFGDAKFYGDLPDLGLNTRDIVAIAPTSNGKGYYLVGADGGFFTFGDAKFHGSLPGIHIHVHDIVGMVATNGGRGYMLVGADGGVFTFGAARFYGSLPGIHIHVRDIRAIVPSSNAAGYFLVGADGGAFTFGNARFHGSLPGEHIRVLDIVGIALTPDNAGYWMAGADGSVYAFGDASGGVVRQAVSSNLPVAAIAST